MPITYNWIRSDQLPVKSWCREPEEGAIDQAANLASLPFAFKHISLMPDVHKGYGMPIGSVLATNGVVVPNAVGVDIGCGMAAMKFNITSITKPMLETILGDIRKAIPIIHRSEATSYAELMLEPFEDTPVYAREYKAAKLQIGTLGGGNHFIEIQQDPGAGNIWVMLHSGSRHLGHAVATHYDSVACENNKLWYSTVPAEHELAFLPQYSDACWCYKAEMKLCMSYAKLNRLAMAVQIFDIFTEHTGCQMECWHDVAHNYARMENHFGHNVIVHRKGAISARKDELGIIPGSQGTCSFIVKGLGNRESFNSCSHGAGRVMGRRKAAASLNLAAEIKRMDDRGILHGIRSVEDLDEAPGAYKDIHVVMAEQADLVEIVTELEPLAVIKG
jgi:tRNA-splicing ligase RtcB